MGDLRRRMLTLDEKVELERIYINYCEGDIEYLKKEDIDEYEFFAKFINFRMDVSGGREYFAGSNVGCQSVEGFLDEICLFDNMMCDGGGAYRGSFCWECYDGLDEILNNSTLTEEIKNEIREGFKEIYGMNK